MSSLGSARVDRESFDGDAGTIDPSDAQANVGGIEAGHRSQETANEPEGIAGERGASALHRARSLQSRASQVLALSVMGALAIGLLGWYYFHTFAARGTAQRAPPAAPHSLCCE